jgi:hypothetical protein
MDGMIDSVSALPVSFWLELSLAVPVGLTVFLMIATFQRAQERHHYRAWREATQRASRQQTARQ